MVHGSAGVVRFGRVARSRRGVARVACYLGPGGGGASRGGGGGSAGLDRVACVVHYFGPGASRGGGGDGGRGVRVGGGGSA